MHAYLKFNQVIYHETTDTQFSDFPYPATLQMYIPFKIAPRHGNAVL